MQAEDFRYHEELRFCFNIPVADDDPFYAGKLNCLPFTRSDSVCDYNGSGAREQFNILTAFIDGNNIYGSDNVRARKLRTLSRGLLKTHRLGPTLPTKRQTDLVDNEEDSQGLVAGDTRAIEQPGLASMHSLFLPLFCPHPA